MKPIEKLLKSRIFLQFMALALIVFGLIFVFHFGAGLLRAYRSIEFARQHNFQKGNLDVDLLRPWMSIRTIAVAYAVPQPYLFDEIGIPMNPVNSELPVGRLNHKLGLGMKEGQPALLDVVGQAILKYRQNPVPTGLMERGVRSWMSIQYISNSTGVPAEYIFKQIGIPMEGHAFMPLERLLDEVEYEPGLRALVAQIQQIVDTYEASP